MKFSINIFGLFLVLMCVFSCSDKSSETVVNTTDSVSVQPSVKKFNLTGTWDLESEGDSFDITLIQSGDSISGHYCAIAYQGNRIDCHVDEWDDCNLYGKFQGNSVVLTFTSCYIGATGQATIDYLPSSDQIKWTLGQTSGEVYAPDTAILARQPVSADL